MWKVYFSDGNCPLDVPIFYLTIRYRKGIYTYIHTYVHEAEKALNV